MKGHTRATAQSRHQKVEGPAEHGNLVVRGFRLCRKGLPRDRQKNHPSWTVIAGPRIAQADDPSFVLGEDGGRIARGSQGVWEGRKVEQRPQVRELLIIQTNGEAGADRITIDAVNEGGTHIFGEVGHVQHIGAERLLRRRQSAQNLGGRREERSSTCDIGRQPGGQACGQGRQIFGTPEDHAVCGEQGRRWYGVGLGKVPDFVIDAEGVEGLSPVRDLGKGQVQLLKGRLGRIQQKSLRRPGRCKEVVPPCVVVGLPIARSVRRHDEVAVNLVRHQFWQEQLG